MELKEYLGYLHAGMYPGITVNRRLYELMLLVLCEEGPTIRVLKYERPTEIESMIFRYNLRGIKITAVPNPFTKYALEYHIVINREPFLANLDIFYNKSVAELKSKYDPIEHRKRELRRKAEKMARSEGKCAPNERFIIARGDIYANNQVETN